jgi:hypothetical protein
VAVLIGLAFLAGLGLIIAWRLLKVPRRPAE